jgi:menaquinol-cytochrome c reductase iron-sulfur subunit
MAHPEGGSTRRGFHLILLNVLGAMIGAAIALPTLVYLLFPPKAGKGAGWNDAGDVSQLTPGAPIEVTFQLTRLDGWRLTTEKKTAWIVKRNDNKVVAYSPTCTHLGCAVHWDGEGKQFACPCHNSFFSIDGKVTGGPAPRPLDQYDTKIDSTRLQIGDLKPSNG